MEGFLFRDVESYISMNLRKIQVLFAIGRLSVGGAEKLLVNQLSAIDKNKFNPYLLTLFSEQKDSFSGQVNLDNKRWKRLNFRSLFDFMEWLRLFKFLKKKNLTR